MRDATLLTILPVNRFSRSRVDDLLSVAWPVTAFVAARFDPHTADFLLDAAGKANLHSLPGQSFDFVGGPVAEAKNHVIDKSFVEVPVGNSNLGAGIGSASRTGCGSASGFSLSLQLGCSPIFTDLKLVNSTWSRAHRCQRELG